MRHHHYGAGTMMGFNWLWILLIVLIIAIAIGALILLLKITRENRQIASERIQALNILNERYAKGEISEEEYHQKRKTLEQYDSSH
ncbi:MAG TPA: SHOCT domain-containing protein [Bacillota bacterium]|nr:SHOCT domain-containing protein [Bacillota bacterium]